MTPLLILGALLLIGWLVRSAKPLTFWDADDPEHDPDVYTYLPPHDRP